MMHNGCNSKQVKEQEDQLTLDNRFNLTQECTIVGKTL
uniref:Uncharacterized protein MANES_05G039500 n=1 Tax=Rhizophora mucronata TaxID=61149 RepID=A0A2P2JYE6_RHIMU